MWLNPFPIIWRSEPVRIPMPADPAATLEAIRARLPGWSLRMWFRDGCIGSVTSDRVRLKRYRPLSRNDFAPLLDATISEEDGSRALVGVLRASWPIRIFLTAWFGIAIAFIPTFLIAGVSSTHVNGLSRIAFMLGPIALFLFARAILAYSQNHWTADARYLANFVAESWSLPPKT